jgi:hypothetical protein
MIRTTLVSAPFRQFDSFFGAIDTIYVHCRKIYNSFIYIHCRKYKIYIYEFFLPVSQRVEMNYIFSDNIRTLKNAKYIRVVENFLALIWVDGRGDYNIQITNFFRITTCNERRINRVHLKFSLYMYTNCQNRSCGKEFNTTAFDNLHIYNVYVNIIL